MHGTWRRRIVASGLLLGLSACGPPASVPAEAAGAAGAGAGAARPHVVLISIDTLRADRLGVYGAQRPLTPNLDAFAQHAWLFERVHANSNNTAPSHMSMLTGVLPPVHGVTHNAELAVAPALPMLAERLREAGYATTAFTDGGYVLPAFGFDRGFQHFEARLQRFDRKLDAIDTWLAAAPEQPTFLFVHTYAVHAPYMPDAAHDRFTDKAYAGPLVERVRDLRALRDRITTAGVEDLGFLSEAFWKDRGAFDAADKRQVQDLYDGCVHEVDAGIGRLLGMLQRKGWLDDAWIIVTSDHGEAFLEHGTWQHRQLHEEELHVPLLIRPPGGLAEGQRIAAWASLVDLVPTLLARLKLPSSPWLQGVDLLADAGTLRTGGARAPPEAAGRVISSWAGEPVDADTEAQVLDDLKRIRKGENSTWFDLGADPREQHPLAAPERGAHLVERTEAQSQQSDELRARLGEPVAAPPLDDESQSVLRQLGYVR